MLRSKWLTSVMCIGLALGCVAARAATLRLPKTGDPAFTVDVPTGWNYDYDQYDNLQFSAADHSTALQLSMITDASVATTTLEAVAAEIFKSAGSQPYSRTAADSIVGHAGEAFYGVLVVNGTNLQMKVILVKMDSTHIACLSTLIRPDANEAQVASLNALIGMVQLSAAQ